MVIGLGMLYDFFLNAASLALSYKAFKANIELIIENGGTIEDGSSLNTQNTFGAVKAFQRITFWMVVVSSSTRIANIIIIVLLALTTISGSSREILLYIGRIYILGMVVESGLYLYMNRKKLFKRRRVISNSSSIRNQDA